MERDDYKNESINGSTLHIWGKYSTMEEARLKYINPP